MTNILVTWVVYVWVTVACPDFTRDVYTDQIKTQYNKECVAGSGDYVKKEMSKEFKSMIEAKKFVNDSPKDYDFKFERVENKE